MCMYDLYEWIYAYQVLVARRAAVRVVAPNEARREVSGASRPAAAGNAGCCLPFAPAQ